MDKAHKLSDKKMTASALEHERSVACGPSTM
jgi:hypothetical protein